MPSCPWVDPSPAHQLQDATSIVCGTAGEGTGKEKGWYWSTKLEPSRDAVAVLAPGWRRGQPSTAKSPLPTGSWGAGRGGRVADRHCLQRWQGVSESDSGLPGAPQRPLVPPALPEHLLSSHEERDKGGTGQATITGSQLQLCPFPPRTPKCREMMQDLCLSPSPHPPWTIPATSTAQPVMHARAGKSLDTTSRLSRGRSSEPNLRQEEEEEGFSLLPPCHGAESQLCQEEWVASEQGTSSHLQSVVRASLILSSSFGKRGSIVYQL